MYLAKVFLKQPSMEPVCLSVCLIRLHIQEYVTPKLTAGRWSFDWLSFQRSEYYHWPECFLLLFREPSKQVRYCNNMDDTCIEMNLLKNETCSIWWNRTLFSNMIHKNAWAIKFSTYNLSSRYLDGSCSAPLYVGPPLSEIAKVINMPIKS